MDLSWSFKSSSSENKENVKSNYISCSSSNVSFTNGVLTLSNSHYTAAAAMPAAALSNTPNGGAGNANDSFDNDKIKLDVYEKSIQKLAMENKSLKKRVQKLTELARSKEEQLIEAFNEAVEDKRRQEEKYKEEHSAQLQSYYECFLQIEKENDMLKMKLEQLKERLSEKEVQLSELSVQQQQQQQQKKSTTAEVGEESDEEREKKRRRTSQINKLSIAKMNEELNGVNKSIEMFIEDKRASTANNLKPICVSEEKHLIEELQKRVDELQLEKEALTKKISSIEASLARWIFRACDYKDELRQMSEKAQKHLEEYTALKAEQDAGKEASTAVHQELIDKHLDELSRLKAECEMKLIETERLLKNKYEIDMCRSKTDYEIEIKTLRVKLESSESELDRLRESNEDFSRMLSRAREELSDMKNRLVESQYVQTEEINEQQAEPVEHGQHHQLNKNKSESSVMAAAANVASRFGLKSVNTVAKQPPPSQLSTQSSSVSIAESEYNQLNRRLEQMRQEVSTLKLKIDQLTLEKKSLQCRNEELAGELDKFTSNKKEQKITAPMSTSTPSSLKVLATKYCQTENYVATISSSVNTQTQTAKQQSSSQLQAADHQLIQSLRIKIEVFKNEMDQMQMSSAREINDLKRTYEERCAKAHAEIMKLESRLAQEKQTLEEIKRQNENLRTKLEEFEQMHSLSKANYEQELAKLQQESSKEKQVSDTIIMQQKKLLNFLQGKLGKDGKEGNSNHHQANHHQDNQNNHHNHLASIFKWKSSNSNPLTANLPKPNSYNVKQQQSKATEKAKNVKPNPISNAPKAVREIEKELKSNYQTYTDMKIKSQASQLIKTVPSASPAKKLAIENNTITLMTAPNDHNSSTINGQSKKQIHVFITGLNTCPTYCHVCQHLIPLIAYASKCQLCSFTCHSNCSSSSVQMQSADDDPLKYCFNNYLTDSFGYNYIQKLAALPQPGLNAVAQSTTELNNFHRTNFLIADNLFIYVDKRWKKIWTVLRIDGNLELYQSSSNHKPFDTISLANDKVQFETSAQRIKKIVATNYASNKSVAVAECDENPYEMVDQTKPKTEISPTLIILLFGPQLCLQIGFNSFAKKNIWYDALQSCNLLATSTSLTKRGTSTSNINEMQRLNTANVIKPFLELCDTIVNSYCFISDKLIALACDDGLYALNSFSSSQDPASTNIFLAKIDGIESAHKLFYHPELGKLCFIGCKSRQFFCIDVNELLTAAANSNSQPAVKRTERMGTGLETDEEDDVNMDEFDETRAIAVRIERVDNMDRCHLFECTMINNVWYIAVATPENIYVYLFNRHLNKFSFVKLITTDTPCLSLKFTTKQTSQLIYGCKEFFALDMTYLQSTPILDSNWLKKQHDDEYSSSTQSPISVCVISSTNSEHEALLLCFEDYGIFVTYANNGWQVSKKLPTSTSSLSNTTTWSSGSSSSSSCLTSHLLRWPRGGGVPPLQVEYDAPLLHLFYNDSIIVYNINFSVESGKSDLNCLPVVKKLGIAFVYKPRYLGSLHTNDANCLIISNRRPLDQIQNMSPASSQFSEIPKHNNADTTDEDLLDSSDAKSSSTKILNSMGDQEITDKICLSYFDPMAH